MRLLFRSLLLVLLVLAAPASAQRAPEADSLDAATLDALPDRTAEALATLLLVSGDDPSLLPTDYRAAGAPQFVVDGLRARRADGLPQAALASLAVPTGYVSPRLGNALGAFVEVDTRDAPRDDLGRAEGLGGLDAYGYGLASVGAGVSTGRLRFFGAGTFERAADLDPRAYGTPVLPADELAALRERPQVIRVDRAGADAAGFDPGRARYTTEDTYYVPLPPSLAEADRASLAAVIGLSDPNAIVSLSPLPSLAVRSGEVPLVSAAPASDGERFRGHLALEAAPTEALRLRLSGQGFRETGRAFSTALVLAAPEAISATRDAFWRGMAEAEADLGSGTLTLAASAEHAERVRYDGRFSDAIGDVLRYGDIDDPANAVAAAYRRYDSFDEEYEPAFQDGSLQPPSVYAVFAGLGAPPQGYARETAEAVRLAAEYRQRVGSLDLAFGAEADEETLRGVEVSALTLARVFNDDNVETPIIDTDGNGSVDAGVDAYSDLPADYARNRVSAYGYDYLGLEETTGGTPIEDFYAGRDDNRLSLAARQPRYLAGYAEGIWEREDLTVRGGLRVARFSSNATALFDRFATVEVYRASDLAAGSIVDPVTGVQILAPQGGVPASIPGTAALYVDFGTDRVIGYRDLDGAFYDATGAPASVSEIVNVGRNIAVEGGTRITAGALADAPATVRVLPRMEAELHVPTGTTLGVFVNTFARQPDPALAFPTLADIEGVRSGIGFAPNGALRPETLTEIGASVQQSVGSRGGPHGEVGATVFLRQYRDLVRLESSNLSFPSGYTTAVNSGEENVPGATLRARLQSGRLGARAAVTVLRETASESVSFSTGDILTQEALAADAVAALAVLTEPTDGPALGSFHPLGSVQLGAVLRVASGETYLLRDPSLPLAFPFENRTVVTGGLQRGPARARLDLRLARAFRLGASAFEASVEIVNVLGRTNALFVYPTTGLPDDDGFLATDPSQISGLGTEAERAAYRSFYSARARDPLNVGRPRQVRVGLRLRL